MAHVREVTRKAGRAYEVRWRDGSKERQKTFTVKRDAERFALKIESEVAAGTPTSALTRAAPTVAKVVEQVLADSTATLKPSTVRSERGVYERRVLPRWGARKISTLHRAEVESWVAELAASGLAPSSVRHCYVALYKACRYALHARYITYNPCVGVRLPKASTPGATARFLTMTEVERLAAALADDDAAPFDLLVRFAAYTGLRAAELVGLRVGDLDLHRGEVHVRQTLQRIDGEWVGGTPKSHRSTRDVPIEHSGLLADLRRYRMQHPESGHPTALLWPGRAVGSHRVDYSRPLGMSSFRQFYLARALTAAGLPPMRFHDFRHTAASLWLAAGYSPAEVSRWLGHANVSITDTVYSHMYPRPERPVQTRFDIFAQQHRRGRQA